MTDLEQEYQALLQSLFGEVKRKFDNGDLSHEEASDLSSMIRDRLDVQGSFLDAEYKAYDENDLDNEYERGQSDGWSSSNSCW